MRLHVKLLRFTYTTRLNIVIIKYNNMKICCFFKKKLNGIILKKKFNLV